MFSVPSAHALRTTRPASRPAHALIATPRRLTIAPDSARSLGAGAGAFSLHVRRGVVWLTETPARGDVVLRPGDRFSTTATPVVIQALGDEADIEVDAGRRG